MKTNQIISLCIALVLGTATITAQEHKETLTATESFSGNTDNLLVVYNIEGDITVESHNGNSVEISAVKKMTGNNERQLNQGKQEIGMKTATDGNIMYVYMDSPYTEFNLATGRFNHRGPWDGIKYHYRLDFTIKVPRNTSLELSTVNRGVILVKNVEAKDLTIKNVNGPITMENVAGKTYVDALNKDINISYSKNPTEDSVYKTLNGDVNISVAKGLNADVSFKTLNGDIFTNLETRTSSSGMNMIKKKGKKGTKYKMNKDTQFQIGSGGVKMDFDLLNGDVTIKE
jgi:DUF4097 and DUF4098 domain-containing protein YvlB